MGPHAGRPSRRAAFSQLDHPGPDQPGRAADEPFFRGFRAAYRPRPGYAVPADAGFRESPGALHHPHERLAGTVGVASWRKTWAIRGQKPRRRAGAKKHGRKAVWSSAWN